MLLAILVMATFTLGLLFTGWLTPSNSRAQGTGGGDPTDHVEAITNCLTEGSVALTAPPTTPAGCVGSQMTVGPVGLAITQARARTITTNFHGMTIVSVTTNDFDVAPAYGVTWSVSGVTANPSSGTNTTAVFTNLSSGCGTVNFTVNWTNQTPCHETNSHSTSVSFVVAQITTNCMDGIVASSDTNFWYAPGMSVTLTATNFCGIVTATNWPGCCTNVNTYGTNFLANASLTNWWTLTYGVFNTNGPGLAVTFWPTNPGSGTATFYEVCSNSCTPYPHTNSVVISFNVISVAMTKPDSNMKVCFSPDNPGTLVINCEATATPDTADVIAFLNGKLSFLIDGIGSSVLTYDNPNGVAVYSGGSFKTTATFTGLPDMNSAFGTKTVTFNYPCGAEVRNIQVFYPAYAANHPSNHVPPSHKTNLIVLNYFYYYYQTIAQVGNPEFDSSSHTLPDSPFITCVEAQIFGSGQKIRDPGPGVKSANKGQNLKYIDLFAWACRHEKSHHTNWLAWWGLNFNHRDPRPRDLDKDMIPDLNEPLMGYDDAGPYDPNDYYTYSTVPNSNYTSLNDAERQVSATAEEWIVGSADSDDWAHPGIQWFP